MSISIFCIVNNDFNIFRHRYLISRLSLIKYFSTNPYNLCPNDILTLVKSNNIEYSTNFNFIEYISNNVTNNLKKWNLLDLSNLTTILTRKYLATNTKIYEDNPLYNLYNIIHSKLLDDIDSLPILTTAKAAAALKLFNKLPIETSKLLTKKVHDILFTNSLDIDTKSLGNILWAIDINVSSNFLHVLLKKITSSQSLLPKHPETWIVYLRFIAKRRFHSRPFLIKVAKMLIPQLRYYKSSNYKLNELIPTVAWFYAITFPLRGINMFNYKQKDIDLIIELYNSLVDTYLEDDIGGYVMNGGISRLAWSLSIQDLLCNYPKFIESLQPNLSNNIDDRRHATMLYYSLRYIEIKSPQMLNKLYPIYEQCTNLLKNISPIKSVQPSKTQRLVSEILNGWRIPHKFEFTTPKLISVDISIESPLYGEKIAVEVDGPWHFLTLHNLRYSVRTGPSFFKHWLLESEGWNVISLKPPSLSLFDSSENSNEIKSQKDEYRKALLDSNSKYLSLLL